MTTYRTAGAGDADALARLRLDYLAEDFGSLSAAESAAFSKELPAYFAAHLGRDLEAWVAEEGGALVSCVLLLTVQKPASPAFPTGRTGILLNVFTAPGFRRRGIARVLVEAAVAGARAAGLSRIDLKATAMGRGLYEKIGFHEDARNFPMTMDLSPCVAGREEP